MFAVKWWLFIGKIRGFHVANKMLFPSHLAIRAALHIAMASRHSGPLSEKKITNVSFALVVSIVDVLHQDYILDFFPCASARHQGIDSLVAILLPVKACHWGGRGQAWIRHLSICFVPPQSLSYILRCSWFGSRTYLISLKMSSTACALWLQEGTRNEEWAGTRVCWGAAALGLLRCLLVGYNVSNGTRNIVK